MQYPNMLLNQLSQLFPASDNQSLHYIADCLLSQSPNGLNRGSPTTASMLPIAYPGANFSPSNQTYYAQAKFPEEMAATCYPETNTAYGMNSNFSTISTSPSSAHDDRREVFDASECMSDFGDIFGHNEISINLNNEGFSTEQTESLLDGTKKIRKSKKETKQASQKPKSSSRRGLWREEEDIMIRELVAKHGPKWAMIGSIIGNKSGKQVRDRYNNMSRPDINNSEWTQEEDSLFVTLLEKHGNKWCKIAAEMPGRTESQVKNKYYCLKRNKKVNNHRKMALKEAINVVQQKKGNCQSSESGLDTDEDLLKPEGSLYSDIDCFFQFTGEEVSPFEKNFDASLYFENSGENIWKGYNAAI